MYVHTLTFRTNARPQHSRLTAHAWLGALSLEGQPLPQRCSACTGSGSPTVADSLEMVATPMEAEKRKALDEMLRQLDDFVRYVQVVPTMLGILAWRLRRVG
jgi:hypothetical protein